MNKAKLVSIFNNLPEEKHIVIDGTEAEFIDDDIYEVIDTYREKAKLKGIDLEVIGMDSKHFTTLSHKDDQPESLQEVDILDERPL